MQWVLMLQKVVHVVTTQRYMVKYWSHIRGFNYVFAKNLYVLLIFLFVPQDPLLLTLVLIDSNGASQ
jgi:hypothetical protein